MSWLRFGPVSGLASADNEADRFEANALGVYGSTFLRGAYTSSSTGTAEFQTIFPGYTSDSANHINLMIHTSSSMSGSVAHVGQVFFTDRWTDVVSQYGNYVQNTNERMLNAQDPNFALANSAGYNAIVDSTIPMPPHNELNEAAFPKANHKSFLVILSARAIGSLGFGLVRIDCQLFWARLFIVALSSQSILAIGFRWLVPLTTPVTLGVVDKPKQQANHRSRRRSTRAAPARLVAQQATPPITVNGQGTTTSNSNRGKHVSFADTLGFQRSTAFTGDPVTPRDDSSTSAEQFLAEESPPPSTLTPSIAPPSPTDSMTVQRDDESIVESDSSSRRTSLSLHLPKRILPFGNKSRQHPGPSLKVRLSSCKHGRRSSIGFVPPWSSRRKSSDMSPYPNDDTSSRLPTPLKSASSASASNDSIQPSVISYLSLKTHHRRISAPTTRMRTQPYDAPYFALPPTSATFDLRKSPATLQEALINSTMQHGSEDIRGRRLQQPRQSLPKRRSVSEGWNNGRRAMKIS
ncbi:hypothetical protein C0995_010465 [Termitomyces sp. Mi166|nr:hypothetical protein C0995_010465 [Termitomyces sp. Mi166\